MDPHFGRPSLSAPVPDPKILNTDYSDAELDDAVKDIICPEDSYTADGTYWADLPFRQRVRWINAQSNAEAATELSSIWSDFKQDPLSPLRQYTSKYVVNGALKLPRDTENPRLHSLMAVSAVFRHGSFR